MKKAVRYMIVAGLAGAGVLAGTLLSPVPPLSDPPPSQNTEAGSTLCAYMWAYHDDEGLTVQLDQQVKSLDPTASASARLFGEDCIYEDGHSTFGVMETDFYIRLPVDDLTDEEFLGNWMEEILTLVAKIPRDEIQGNYGFVEFVFETSPSQSSIVRVPIQDYLNLGRTVIGDDLYQLFSTP